VRRAAADEYVEAARLHGEATERGDHELANQQYDALIDALRRLRSEAGGEGPALLDMLDHEDPHVRCCAATHLLAVDPERALEALEALGSTPGIAGFNAKMVLSEWRKGQLRLPWPTHAPASRISVA
jgi:hypothetical protein